MAPAHELLHGLTEVTKYLRDDPRRLALAERAGTSEMSHKLFMRLYCARHPSSMAHYWTEMQDSCPLSGKNLAFMRLVRHVTPSWWLEPRWMRSRWMLWMLWMQPLWRPWPSRRRLPGRLWPWGRLWRPWLWRLWLPPGGLPWPLPGWLPWPPQPPAVVAPLHEAGRRQPAKAAHDRVEINSGGYRDPGRPPASPGRDRLQYPGVLRAEQVPREHRASLLPGRLIHAELQQLHHILRAGHAHRAPFPDRLVAAGRLGRGHRTGHRHQRPALVVCVAGGVQRPAPQCRLHHNGAAAEGGNHPVADQEPRLGRHPAWWPLTDERAHLRDLAEEPFVGLRVGTVHPACQDRDGGSCHGERATVRAAVDPESTAGHDRPPLVGERDRQLAADVGAVAGRRPGSHHRHRPKAGVAQVLVPAHPQSPGPGVAQHVELTGPFGVAGNDQAEAVAPPRVQLVFRRHLPEPCRPPAQGALQPWNARWPGAVSPGHAIGTWAVLPERAIGIRA